MTDRSDAHNAWQGPLPEVRIPSDARELLSSDTEDSCAKRSHRQSHSPSIIPTPLDSIFATQPSLEVTVQAEQVATVPVEKKPRATHNTGHWIVPAIILGALVVLIAVSATMSLLVV